MPLHDGEIPVDERTVRALLRAQRSELADLPIRLIGGGTDNTMFRVGTQHVVRLPRTPEHVAPLQKELTWLPRFRGALPCAIPQPEFAGRPDPAFPLSWAMLEWIDGAPASEASVDDWPQYGRDLAEVVRALRDADLQGAIREGPLVGYRGDSLHPLEDPIAASFADVRRHPPAGLDLDVLQERWQAALALPDPSGPTGWLHGDLKPSNVLVRDGRLHAVIDFGGLCIGHPDAEHAATWDLPAAARDAYREALGIDDAAWMRSAGWAIAVGMMGLPYYRDTFPAFVEECLRRLHALAA